MSKINRAFCWLMGHRYFVEMTIGFGARKVGCTRCGRRWAMHDGTKSFLPWDFELEDIYAELTKENDNG